MIELLRALIYIQSISIVILQSDHQTKKKYMYMYFVIIISRCTTNLKFLEFLALRHNIFITKTECRRVIVQLGIKRNNCEAPIDQIIREINYEVAWSWTQ